MSAGNMGELAALGAVAGWTFSSLAFESAGKRVGSLPVNVIRLVLAGAVIAAVSAFRGLSPWPAGLGSDAPWLLLSGFVGFFLGDLLLFRSYVIIGARMAMLVMSLSPPISALMDWLVFKTTLSWADGAGILMTVSGVALAVLGRRSPGNGDLPSAPPRPAASRALGFLLAFGGALGQSGGMILGKLGLEGHDPFAATFVRILGGLAGFVPLVFIVGAAGRTWKALSDRKAMGFLSIGAVAGPVLGVTAVMTALLHSPAGVVSAITAIVPVTIILPSALFLGDRPRLREIVGAAVSVAGVAVLFLT